MAEIIDNRDDEPHPPAAGRVVKPKPDKPAPVCVKQPTLDDCIIELLDVRSTEASALLGASAYVDFCVCRLPGGGMQVRWSVGKEHNDGYKLQELGSGQTFYEALMEAAKAMEGQRTIRPRTDQLGRQMQRTNVTTEQQPQVRGELAKLERGR